jgi:hypothetical protein
MVTGGALAASPLVSGVVGAVNLLASPAVSFTQSAFTPLIGTTFKVAANGSRREITLDAVKAGWTSAGGESFSLLFDGDADSAFTQDTYQVRHSSLGQFAMFIVPINQPKGTQRYEAVINTRSHH